MTLPALAQEILGFWFGDARPLASREVWFRKDEAFDAEIRQRFAQAVERALAGEFDGWQAQPPAALARLLLLDQFTRNAWRDTPRAFAGDALALAGARALVHTGGDEALEPWQRLFAYLPFEHAESLAEQDEAMRLFGRLAQQDAALADNLDWARRHHEVIARFGRFPHRNLALGRISSEAEEAFLRQPGSRF